MLGADGKEKLFEEKPIRWIEMPWPATPGKALVSVLKNELSAKFFGNVGADYKRAFEERRANARRTMAELLLKEEVDEFGAAATYRDRQQRPNF